MPRSTPSRESERFACTISRDPGNHERRNSSRKRPRSSGRWSSRTTKTPSMRLEATGTDTLGVKRHAFGQRDEDRGLELARRGARVGPPPAQHIERDGAFIDVDVAEVGDLELAARRGRQRSDEIKAARVVHVTTGDDVARLRVLGLLLDTHDAVAADPRDDETLGFAKLALLVDDSRSLII